MLGVLRDEHSLGYYRRDAREQPPHIILEALSLVKEAVHEGKTVVTVDAEYHFRRKVLRQSLPAHLGCCSTPSA